MTMRISLSYTTDLEDKLAAKSYLGHYANDAMPKEHGRYEADRGWDALFSDHASAESTPGIRRRAGATARDERIRPAQAPGHQPEQGVQQFDRGEGSHLQGPNS